MTDRGASGSGSGGARAAASRPLRYGGLWRTLGWLLVLLVVLLSVVPRPPSVGTGWDKSNHLIGYGVLMWWCRQAFVSPAWRTALWLALLGAMLECVQSTIGRFFEIADMIANTLGVVLGWLLTLTPAGRLLAWSDAWLARVRSGPSH